MFWLFPPPFFQSISTSGSGSPPLDTSSSLNSSTTSSTPSSEGLFNPHDPNANSKLYCFLLNARSLKTVTATKNKLIQFQHLMYSKLPGLVAVTETWLINENIVNSEILPNGYNIFRLDPLGGRRGGDILLIYCWHPEMTCLALLDLSLVMVEKLWPVI